MTSIVAGVIADGLFLVNEVLQRRRWIRALRGRSSRPPVSHTTRRAPEAPRI